MSLTRRQFLLGMTAAAGAAVLPFRPNKPLIVGEIGLYESTRFVETEVVIDAIEKEIPGATVTMFTTSGSPPGWVRLASVPFKEQLDFKPARHYTLLADQFYDERKDK